MQGCVSWKPYMRWKPLLKHVSSLTIMYPAFPSTVSRHSIPSLMDWTSWSPTAQKKFGRPCTAYETGFFKAPRAIPKAFEMAGLLRPQIEAARSIPQVEVAKSKKIHPNQENPNFHTQTNHKHRKFRQQQ